METKFFLARHGQSEARMKNIVQGVGLKVPLTEEGRQQAGALAQKLKDFHFDRIFSSPAKRTLETAEAVRKFHPETPLETFSGLNERSKGLAEGMDKEEFNRRFPEIIKQWRAELDARPEGGENYEDVEKRVIPLIEKHLKDYAGQTLLYVGHGNVMKVILGWTLNIPYGLRPRIAQDYCALDCLVFDHERKYWRIEFINQKCF